MNEESIFLEAVSRPFEERPAFLDDACKGRPELRAAVEKLLAAHSMSDNILDKPPMGLNQTVDSAPASPNPLHTAEFTPQPSRSSLGVGNHGEAIAGVVIHGRYILQRKLGEGGMGAVWLANQTDPVKRQVALKLIKVGTDSQEVVARFNAERQALALMDHPHIARVFDGGSTEYGQPFFVMELVQGVPITDYCDQQRLCVKARLELFVSVCQAVQHAHQKGIIHRDLKPSNVLVTEVDGRPTPKVIDFGVAKATEIKLTDMSFSDVGAIVGTPMYMSPEQADASMDIDTRTDVYALGVILYELLTGSPPIDAKQFKRGAIIEILRMVREVEPARPSTKLNSADALPSIAANRDEEPARLTRLLKRELDWVVMKALEKDRARRYDTANGLSRDIQRYLANEVVDARPPSTAYRLRKFVSRNKVMVSAACLVAMTLIGGIVGTTMGLIRANEANARAQARLKQVEKGNDVLTSIFNDLDMRAVKADKDPLEAVLAKRLVKAAEQLDGDALGDPLVVADLQVKLAVSLISLGYPFEAIPLLEKARTTREKLLGKKDPNTLKSMYYLAWSYWEASHYAKALPLHQETLDLRKVVLGPRHEDTLRSMHSLAATLHYSDRLKEAHRLYDETLKLRKDVLGSDHPETLKTMANLANVYCEEKNFEVGLPLHEAALDKRRETLGADHPDTLQSRMAAASCYRLTQNLERARELEEETLRLSKAKLGNEHPTTLYALATVASDYSALGMHEQVLPLYQEILRYRRTRLGEDHPDTIRSMHLLADAYLALGKIEEVLPLYRDAVRINQAQFGENDVRTLRSRCQLSNAYRRLGQYDEALQEMEEVLRLSKIGLGEDHSETYLMVHYLARIYGVIGQHDKALNLEEEALARALKALGPDHAVSDYCFDQLSQRYLEVGVMQAWSGRQEDLVKTAERMMAKNRDSNSPVALERTAKVWCLLEEATPQRRAEVLAAAAQAVKLGKGGYYFIYFQMALGLSQYRSGLYAEAASTLSTTVANPRAKEDPHVLGTCGFFRAMCLHRQGKAAEAMALATSTAQAMKPYPSDESKPLSGNFDIDDLVLWMAFKEAKSLIGFVAK